LLVAVDDDDMARTFNSVPNQEIGWEERLRK